jgi:hypothetical protein
LVEELKELNHIFVEEGKSFKQDYAHSELCTRGIVILNGGEAAAKDRTITDGFNDMDGNTFNTCNPMISSTASVLRRGRQVPRRACALLRMTSRGRA